MKITNLATLFARDPELINDEQLKQLHDWAMHNIAILTMKRHANEPNREALFQDAVNKFDAYAEEQMRRFDLEMAERKAG